MSEEIGSVQGPIVGIVLRDERSGDDYMCRYGASDFRLRVFGHINAEDCTVEIERLEKLPEPGSVFGGGEDE